MRRPCWGPLAGSHRSRPPGSFCRAPHACLLSPGPWYSGAGQQVRWLSTCPVPSGGAGCPSSAIPTPSAVQCPGGAESCPAGLPGRRGSEPLCCHPGVGCRQLTPCGTLRALVIVFSMIKKPLMSGTEHFSFSLGGVRAFWQCCGPEPGVGDYYGLAFLFDSKSLAVDLSFLLGI